MKLKQLVAASVIATAALSGQAMAAAPATPFVTPAIDVYLTGASAPQNILGALAESLFGANSIVAGVNQYNNFHVLYDNGSTIGASYRAYYGQLQSAQTVSTSWGDTVTLPAGTLVRLSNRAKGGSVWGVNPVARNQAVAWMPITNTNCTAVAGNNTYNYTCGEAGNDLALTGRIPDFGVSDVAPDMFKGPYNVEFGQSQLSPTEASRLTATATSGLLFGVPVTTNVPAGISFNRANVTGILSGSIVDWTQLDPTMTGNTQMVVCRRVQGSGTQATYNAYFNKFPCTQNALVGGVIAPLRMADSAGFSETTTTITVNPTAGLTVIENPSSGNVRTCMTLARNGGTHTFTSDNGKAVSVNFGAGGYRAFGTLSLDSTPDANWGFRQLNGVDPTKANLRTGQYDFYSELSMQYRNDGHTVFDTSTNTSSFVSTPVGPGSSASVKNHRAFIERFISRAADPAILNLISSTTVRNATAALPLQYAPDETTPAGLNTMYVTQQGNACGPVQRF